MAVNRVLSPGDRNLNTTTLVTSRRKVYKDIDLSFEKRPSGDVYKKIDAAAVKQAVSNLIQTNHYEKPFNPFYGGNIRALLFELADDDTAIDIEEEIKNAIRKYEPRAEIISVQATSTPDYNSIKVTTEFKVVNTEETIILTTNLSRLR